MHDGLLLRESARESASQARCVLLTPRAPGRRLRSRPYEKPRSAAFAYVAPGAEQRGAGREGATEREEIVFVAARAMQKQQGRGGGISPGFE